MRLKYYQLTLRQMSVKKSFVFFLTVVISTLIFSFLITNNVKPIMKVLCETNAKTIALQCTNAAIEKNIENVHYESLVTFQKDSNGKIIALSANVMEINRLTSKIATSISQELSQNEEGEIRIPLGSFFGLNMTSGFGPKINIKTIPAGDIVVNFKSEFTNAGINQTKHRIYAEITTSVKIVAPFYANEQSYTDDVTVAETILVGDTPSQYYSINGMEVKDAIDIAN